jgi:hypothetical protein
VYTSFKAYVLPEKIANFGGLAINGDTIVSGEFTILSGGPLKSYTEMWKTLLQDELEVARKSLAQGGWSEALQKRIQNFIDNGLSKMVGNIEERLVLSHSDFCKHLPHPDSCRLLSLI